MCVCVCGCVTTVGVNVTILPLTLSPSPPSPHSVPRFPTSSLPSRVRKRLQKKKAVSVSYYSSLRVGSPDCCEKRRGEEEKGKGVGGEKKRKAKTEIDKKEYGEGN